MAKTVKALGSNVLIEHMPKKNDTGFVTVDDDELYAQGTIRSIGPLCPILGGSELNIGDEVIYVKEYAYQVQLGFSNDLVLVDEKYLGGVVIEETDDA